MTVRMNTVFLLFLALLPPLAVRGWTALGEWGDIRNIVAAYEENSDDDSWEILLKFEARAHSKHRCTDCQTPPWLAPWIRRPRVMYALSNNDRPKKQWTSDQTDYYFHSGAGTDNTCPKYEGLEKDSVGVYTQFE